MACPNECENQNFGVHYGEFMTGRGKSLSGNSPFVFVLPWDFAAGTSGSFSVVPLRAWVGLWERGVRRMQGLTGVGRVANKHSRVLVAAPHGAQCGNKAGGVRSR